jgi:glycerophosphoryl diester phosphodiesterase
MSIEKFAKRNETENQTKIIWHKCNSAAKFLEAINTEYVAGLEYDVVGTSDNVPVVFHDKSIEINLGDNVDISKISFDDLRRIRPDINSLRKIFEAVSQNILREDFEFHLEIKPNNPALTDAIMKLLQEFSQIDRQTVPRSFQNEVLIDIKKRYPKKKICLLLGDKSFDPFKHFAAETTAFEKLPEKVADIERICGGFTPEFVSVDYKMLTNPFINAMKGAGIQVDVYTLNDINEINGFKVDRIVTDKPKEILEELAKRELNSNGTRASYRG